MQEIVADVVYALARKHPHSAASASALHSQDVAWCKPL